MSGRGLVALDEREGAKIAPLLFADSYPKVIRTHAGEVTVITFAHVARGILAVPARFLRVLALPCVLPWAWGPPAPGLPARCPGLRPGVLAGPRQLRPRPPFGPCCSLTGTGADTLNFSRKGYDVPTKEVIWTERDTMTECLQLFSAGEQDAILAFMDGVTPRRTCLERLLLARRRAYLKACSDAETDIERRLLVGARLPKETAERYRKCACEHGLSLYRFTCDALEREYRRLTK